MAEVRRLVLGESDRLRIGYVASAVQDCLGPALASPRTTADLNKPLQPHHDLRSLRTRRRGCSQIEHFVDRELKATLGNKRVDREHQHTNEQGGEGESRGSTTVPLRTIAILD